MSFNDKIKKYIENKKLQMQQGLVVTQQMKAEKQRKKLKKMEQYKPGTFRYGIAMKQSTRDFMRDVYEKRKEN